jgi:hypothetical protein
VPVTPHGRDTVDYFLFDLQRGYFDYHASAMAIMLRTLGVPARVATGYVIDPRTQLGGEGSYKLTQKNAYAWPEVYFPGIGWVEFSPSPDQPRITRRTDAPLAEPTAGADSNERGLGDEVIFGDSQPAGPLSASGAADGGGSNNGLTLLIAVGAVVAVAAVTAGVGRFAWEYGMGGLSRPAQLWEKTVRLATLGNARPVASETPREFAARLRRDVIGADAAGYIAAKYEGARFGQKTISEDEAEKLESAWSSLRSALLRRALRLKGKG